MMLRNWICIPYFIFVLSSALIAAEDRPNVLLIMADDLGFSDLGCYGGEIQTPNLDGLAEKGLRFNQFYNTGRCWPTRASLLTGYYPHSVRRDVVEGVASGGRGTRPDWAPLICRPLRAAGYRNYHTGKWHLDGMPIASGFDRSYYLKDQHRFFNPTLHWKDDEKLPPVPKNTGFYATVALADHAIECLREHADSYSDQPFFHYLAFAAPHFPLQALPQDIERYRDTYRSGWNQIRQERWNRIESLGIISGGLSNVMQDIGPPYDFPEAIEQLGDGEVNRPIDWDDLTPQQQDFQATKMAIHAAMIDCMDRQIGRVLNQLKAMDEFENTIVIFLSDNGASAEIMVRGDGHDPSAPMGSWASHLCLGPGWSTACNTPFRYHKTWTHEGGIATPLIVHWSNGLGGSPEDSSSGPDAGQWRQQPAHVIDIWPTVLDLCGVTDHSEGPSRPGKSLRSALQTASNLDRTLWWSHEGNRALRQGDWKVSVTGEKGSWELYQLDGDRTEMNNLAEEHPHRLNKLVEIWQRMNDRHTERALSESP